MWAGEYFYSKSDQNEQTNFTMCGNGSSFGWKNVEETEESLPELVIDEDPESDIAKYDDPQVIGDDGELVTIPPLVPCLPKAIGPFPELEADPEVITAAKRAPFATLFEMMAEQKPGVIDALSSECSRRKFQLYMRHDRWKSCVDGVDPLTGKLIPENEKLEAEHLFGPINPPKTDELELETDLPAEPTTQPPTPPPTRRTPSTTPTLRTPSTTPPPAVEEMFPIARLIMGTAYGKTAERINDPRYTAFKKTRSGHRY